MLRSATRTTVSRARSYAAPAGLPPRRGLATARHEDAGQCTLSLQSWFFKPAFGMDDFEILGRGSAMIAKRLDGSPVVLTTLHNVDPARMPHYCGPEDGPTAWMHHVRPEEVRVLLQVLDDDGETIDEVSLERDTVTRHAHRDLAAIEFMDDPLARSFLDKHQLKAFDFEAYPPVVPPLGDAVICHGHIVSPRMIDGEDASVSVPYAAPGAFALYDNVEALVQKGEVMTVPQIYVENDRVLDSGMCGGAVQGASGIIGMVEGIVSAEASARFGVPQLAAVIPASEIAAFVASLPSTQSPKA